MKKTLQVIVALFCLPLLLLSQNKYALGFNLASQISVMEIEESHSAMGLDEIGGIGYGYAAGVQIQYALNQKCFLRSGASYQRLSHRHEIDGFRFSTDAFSGTTSSIQNNVTLSSIGIPLEMGYRINSKNTKFNFLLGAGGLIHIPLGTKSSGIILHDNVEDEPLSDPDNQVDASVYSLGLFTGFECSINDKWRLNIEPNIRMTPNQFTLMIFHSTARTKLEAGLTMRMSMH